jgi:hypothetical protein
MSCSGLTSDFYMIAFKENMSDLKWFGNTEYDTKSGFVFHKPNQIHQWDVKEPWTGYHILILHCFKSTILTLVFIWN